MVGMLARIPRAVSVSALQDVDLHALTVGIILALLVGQTLFAPRVARRVNLTCAALTGLTAVVSLLWVEHLTVAHVFPVVRLIAASATLVALVGFVSNSVYEYGRLWEEHRLMQTLAMCDPLTDLPNRRACEASLLREIARATREGGVFSVVMLDVDHFKSINDQFGHEAGDQALVAVADILRRSLRASDEAARWAGDEFVLVLPATSIENAHFVAERIRRAVGAAQLRPAEATVTLGVAEFIAGQDDPQTLLARADANLYEAKRKGRNCTVAA
jgi:diguanylate cyclase (GGDEF)-like protein